MLLECEPDSQLPGRQFRLLQGHVDNLGADLVQDAVPDPARMAVAVFEPGLAEGLVAVIPAIERRLRDAELFECKVLLVAGHPIC